MAYFAMIKQEEIFESLSDEEKIQMNIFDLLVATDESVKLLQKILTIF